MKVFSRHKIWWVLLITFTIVVSWITSKSPDVMNIVFSTAGHLAFSLIASLIPLIIYWIIRKPLTTEEYMSTFTVAWLILAVANLSVM